VLILDICSAQIYIKENLFALFGGLIHKWIIQEYFQM